MTTTIPEDLGRDSARARRAPVVLDRLAEAMPDATIALHYEDTWQLLIVTMLSAQTTDKKVNEVSPELFGRWPNPQALAAADPGEVEAVVGPLGFYRQKSHNIQATARLVLERHGGEVPRTMDELTALPGVARKTANVVLANGFATNVGVVVDTHVSRLAQRLGFTRQTDPVRIERDLMRLLPRERWLQLSDLLIHHGRRTCVARQPACDDCVVEPLCPSSQIAGRRDRWRAARQA